MTQSNRRTPLTTLLRWGRPERQPANGRFALRAAIGLLALIGFAILVQVPLPASAQADGPQAVPDVPDKPTATAVYEGMVDLEWNDVQGARSYDVQAFKSDWFDLPGNGVEIAFYGPGAIIRSLVPESRYYFRVRASNSLGSSEWSEHLHVHPTGGDFGNWDGVPEPTNSPATGAPTISGTAELGETLTVNISDIADENGLDRVKFNYQWISRDGSMDSNIEGATSPTYMLRTEDQGKSVRVRVSFTDRGGFVETRTSEATSVLNAPATGAPTISGAPRVGKTLMAGTSGIADSNGLDNATFSYQWISRDGGTDSDIEGATSSTYTLRTEDQGKSIRVRVSFTDSDGFAETLTSEATSVVAPPNSPATGAPTISGTPRVGETLTADTPGIADSNGLDNATFSYQWISRDGGMDSNIEGATSSTYTLRTEDQGKSIRVRASFTDSDGFAETLTSEATSVVAPPNSPATGAPTINGGPGRGSYRVGQTLTAATSGIADSNGLVNATFSYQWVRSDQGREKADIETATGSTYTLVTDDQGKNISVRVTFTDDWGNPETLTSPRSARVWHACPGGEYVVTATAVEVGAVPIVVESTTAEYFVLYVRPDLDSDREIPVSVTLGQDGATTLTEQLPTLPKEHYRVEKFLIGDPGDIDFDCIGDITELADPVGMNPLNPAPAIPFVNGAVAIPDRETFESLSYQGYLTVDVELTDLEFVKFYILGMDTNRPVIYFMNTQTHQIHRQFRDAIIPWHDPLWHRYEVEMRGEIVYHPNVVAPDGSLGVYRYESWPTTTNAYSFEDVAYSYELLAASMPLLDNNLAYYPMWAGPLRDYHEERALFDDSRINVLFEEDIMPDVDFVPLNMEEGYGFLRIMSLEERPNPRDIVIYETPPNELSRVAGIITTVPQTPLSHVNLRAVLDGVPNAFIRDALEDADIDDLIGSYVHYTVAEDGWTLHAATPEEVDAHYAASRPSETHTPERDLTVTQITPLSDIEFDDWNAFGVKAVNVAMLRTLGFPDGTVPDGFAVPFYFYDEFMKHNGFYDDVEEMLDDPEFQSDFDTQEDELKKLRKKIKKGETPQWMTAALEEMHAAFPEGTSLRYRSSTNNEDLPGFSGAGLYDSKTQHPEETEEDGIAKSLKQVYASLWNFRAFAEREFHRIDHLAAAMGVLVHPNYSDELANGVAVSFDPFYGTGGYYVNTQLGEDLVTNPDALSVPEEILLVPSGTYRVLATSNQVPDGRLLMSDDQMHQLRGHLEVIHDRFAELYGIEAGEPFAMEIEFKITSDNVLAIKQARPWVFSEAAVAEIPPDNSPATGAPAIYSTPQVGRPLRADTSLIADEDGLANAVFHYQWITNDGTADADIAGAAGVFYTPTDDDVGKTVTVTVSFTDDEGNPETLTSDPTGEVAAKPNTSATGVPTISGTAQVGETLTADDSGIADEEGLTNVVFTYQWLRNDGTADTHIADAIGVAYTLVSDDEGKTIKVTVAFTDDGGNPKTRTSDPTGVVAARPNNAPEGLPAINGIARVGEELKADTSRIADADGLNNANFSYQWITVESNSDGDIEGSPNEDSIYAAAMTVGEFTSCTLCVGSDTGTWLGYHFPGPSSTYGALSQESFLLRDGVAYGVAAILLANSERVQLVLLPHPQDMFLDLLQGFALRLDDFELSFSEAHVSDFGLVKFYVWEDPSLSWSEGQQVNVSIVDSSDSATPLTNGTSTPDVQAAGVRRIGGKAQMGRALTASIENIGDPSDLGDAPWSEAEITGATSFTYTLVADDAGKAIRVKVSFTDDADNEEILTSAATAAVAATLPTKPLNLTVTRGSQIQELAASWQTPASDGGSDITGYRVQWKEATGSWDTAADVSQETVIGTTYTITGLTEGVEYAVRVVATNQVGEGPASAEKTAVPRETRAPEVVTSKVDGATLRVVYDEALDEGSAPPADAFDVRVVCRCDDMTWLDEDARRAVNLVSVNGDTVMLTLTSPATADDYVVVSYNPPSDEASPRVQDVAGNAAAAIRPTQIFNDTEEARETAEDPPNNPATGAPTISGTAQVGEALTADKSGITDEDGLDNAIFSYQWIAGGTDIDGATGSSYTLTASEEGETVKVRVTFTDDTGNDESLTSTATSTVAPRPPLTVSLVFPVASHHGASNVFAFDIRFSEEFPLSYETLKFHAFSVTGGEVLKAQRMDKPSNIPWRITVRPDSNEDVTVVLPATVDCDDQGAICTEDGRKLPNSLDFTVSGPVEPAPNSAATGAPAITGTAHVGETLMADTSEIADGDGLTNVVFSYQWMADDTNIQGATDPAYTLADRDEGKTITVRVSFTDDAGNTESLPSAATAAVTRPPPQAPEMYAISIHDGMLRVSGGRLLVKDPSMTSGVPAADVDSYISSFKVQWKSGSQEYDATRQAVLAPEPVTSDRVNFAHMPSYDITGLTNGVEYTVRVIATNAGGDGPPSQERTVAPNPKPEQLRQYIEKVVEEYEDSHPWLRTTWDYLQNNNIPLYVWDDVYDAPRSYYFGDSPGLSALAMFVRSLNFDESTADAAEPVKKNAVLGKLAGTYTLMNGVSPNPGPLGIAYMYFEVFFQQPVRPYAGCNPRDLYFDVVMALLHDSFSGADHWNWCMERSEDATALEVVRSALNGQTPAWFAETYHDPEGIPDLERFWAHVQGAGNEIIAYQLRDSFGGYCDTDPAFWIRIYRSADTIRYWIGNTLLNPWQDGGCVPSAPISLAANPEGGGTASVSWNAPESNGGSLLSGYRIEWQRADAEEGSNTRTKYVLFNDYSDEARPSEVSETIDGLTDGVDYTVRVVAYNPNGDGPAVDVTVGGAALTGAPTISGIAQVGEELTAETSGIADADGLSNVEYSYQWIRNDGSADTDIAGATESRYTLVEADEGKTIKVKVTFTNGDTEETRTSHPTGVVAARPNLAADLEVGTPSVDDVSLSAGSQFTLSVTVTNAGDGASEATRIRYFRSTDSTITSSDTEEGSESIGALAAAGTSDHDGGMTAPSEAGTYYYGACVDSVTDESDTTDNCSSSVQITVSEPAPDLLVILIDASDNIVTGGSFLVEVTVTNQGDAQSAATTLRWKQLVDGTTTEIGTAAQQALTPPQGSSKTIRLTAPSTPGTSYYWACVDSVTGESDTTNNCSRKVTVTVTNNLATGMPTISGTAQVGQTLTADTSGIADEDGLTNVVFSYQWTRSDGGLDTNITGATGATYTLVAADEDKTIKVTVSFTDAEGNPETLTSAPTGEVEAKPNTEATGAPTIDGAARVGETLTADTSGIDDDDGLNNATFSYQWTRNDGSGDTNIQDATGSSYTLVAADEGRTIKVTVSFTDAEGNPETLTSEATSVIEPPNSPATRAPAINGVPWRGNHRVGQTLTADTSGITDSDGLDNPTFSYQWERRDQGREKADIEGATGSTYTLVTNDQGANISVRVTFTDASGNPETLTSPRSARVWHGCPGGEYVATPAAVEVGAVPIVVQSTTAEYFVLYVRPDLDGQREIPVSVTLGQDGTTTLTEQLSPFPKEHYRVEKFLVADPGDVDFDCIDDITELADPVGMNPLNPAPSVPFVHGAVTIPDRETFEALSYQGKLQFDTFLTDLEFVKFYILGIDTTRPVIYFQNTETHQTHYQFRGSIVPWYDPLWHRYEGEIRGQVVYHPNVVAPDGSLGVYRYEFWRIRADDYSLNRTVAKTYEVLAASMPLLDNNLAYHPRTETALQAYHQERALYDDSRVNVLLEEDILPDVDFLPLNLGEGYGFLRVMSLEERPDPRDIVIYEALPTELSRVAGIITTVPQTPLSHVNLRAVQDGVPNAFIRDALDNSDIDDLIGSYVHYTVAEDGWTLRAATPAEVAAHYAASRPVAEQAPERDLSVTAITPLSEVGFDDWTAFGVKAANVAVLGTLGFPAGTVPDGFAVPFYFYDEFMKHNDFYDDIEELLADPDFQSDFDTQEDELKKLRRKIKKGETPAWMTEALEEMHAAFPEGASLRYRSSTNNEDLPGFSGAGLYDSKTQHPEETEEDGIAKSLKQVYASLWNFRAFTEREFHRIDHLAAAMGVLVHPNYSGELANGVAVSFDPFYGTGGYYVNTQLGEDLVTNPEAHSVPEEVLLHQTGAYDILSISNQVPNGELLMSDAQIDQLRRHLEVIHGTFVELYGIEAGEPFAMEIEFKITSEDILAIKQARPWVFSHTKDASSNRNTLATGAPTIDGAARVGETLIADTSGISDDDGLTNVAFSYQWLAGNADIAGATGATYTLVAADEGTTIKVVVSFTDDAGNEETLTSDPTGEVAPDPGPLTTFTLVDASTDPDTLLETLEDGGTLTLEDPDSDIYGIRVDTDSNHDDHDDIHKVVLALSGAKDVSRPEKRSPYSLYGDSGGDNLTGENLPVGSYTLTAKAYDTNGDVLGTLTVSFTVAAQEQTARSNTEATGAPAIDGIARVGETLTADTSGIDDDDGLTNVAFSYRWLRSDGGLDTNITGATGATYTLVKADAGRTIKLTVSFTDDAGNPETLTSAATDAVAPDPGTLTGFALLDASDQTVVATLGEGDEVGLPDPADGIYTIPGRCRAWDDHRQREAGTDRSEGRFPDRGRRALFTVWVRRRRPARRGPAGGCLHPAGDSLLGAGWGRRCAGDRCDFVHSQQSDHGRARHNWPTQGGQDADGEHFADSRQGRTDPRHVQLPVGQK